MANRPRYTIEQVVASAKKNKGKKHLMAKELGCDYDTILNYEKRHPDIRTAILAELGEYVDLAELKLRQKVMDGNLTAIMFVLKSLGKDRGYVERSEITGKDGEAFSIEIVRRAAP